MQNEGSVSIVLVMVPVDCAVLANVKLVVFWLKVAGTKELKEELVTVMGTADVSAPF